MDGWSGLQVSSLPLQQEKFGVWRSPEPREKVEVAIIVGGGGGAGQGLASQLVVKKGLVHVLGLGRPWGLAVVGVASRPGPWGCVTPGMLDPGRGERANAIRRMLISVQIWKFRGRPSHLPDCKEA